MWVLKRVVGNPLEILMERVHDLSSGNGDLTARVQINSQDEMGDIAKYINIFIEKSDIFGLVVIESMVIKHNWINTLLFQ